MLNELQIYYKKYYKQANKIKLVSFQHYIFFINHFNIIINKYFVISILCKVYVETGFPFGLGLLKVARGTFA